MKTNSKSEKAEVFGRVRRSFPRLQRILVPLDFSGKSRQALSYAVPIAQKFSARITLLHVLPPPDKKARPDQVAARKARAERRMRDTMAALLPPSLPAEPIVKTGEPAREILALAASQNIDLIAIATEGATGIRRLIKGSTTDTVLRGAPCPVLTVQKK